MNLGVFKAKEHLSPKCRQTGKEKERAGGGRRREEERSERRLKCPRLVLGLWKLYSHR